jgi:hypothetical protein
MFGALEGATDDYERRIPSDLSSVTVASTKYGCELTRILLTSLAIWAGI